jgi:hypothetical protein
VNLLIDGKNAASNLAYVNSTAYISLNAGSHRIQVQPVNSTSTIVDQNFPGGSGTSQTIFMTGSVANLKTFVLTDGGTTAVTGGSHVRVINASSTMGPADAYILAAGTPLSGTPTVSAVPFDGDTGYQLLAASSQYQVFMTVPGTTKVLLNTGPVTLSSSQNQTVVALDGVSGGFTFTVLVDQ